MSASINTKALPRPASHSWDVLAILSALMGFGSISTDLYLPAMPSMAMSLGANTGLMELTISTYLIGFSVGQLGWGPISDRYGRKIPIAVGILLFIIGSAGCAIAQNVHFMLGARLIQALGACSGVVLARAMVRDMYEGPRAAQMLSTLIAVMAIAPLIGPLAGGTVLHFAGWRAIFWVLVVIGIATLLTLLRLPETLPPWRHVSTSMPEVVSRYLSLLNNKRFMYFAGTGAFFYGGMFAYVAGSPAAYISYYGLPPEQYGLFFALGILGIMVTNFFNAHLVKQRTMYDLILKGTLGAALSSLILIITAYTGIGKLWGLVLPLLGFIGVTGFIVANSIAGALADIPEAAGSASALIGAMQYGSGIIGAGLVGAFANGTPVPMALVITLSGLGSAACAVALQKLKHGSDI